MTDGLAGKAADQQVDGIRVAQRIISQAEGPPDAVSAMAGSFPPSLSSVRAPVDKAVGPMLEGKPDKRLKAMNLPSMDESVRRTLAPTGVLRAGINLSNFLLVSSRTADGGPAGVSPDMAATIASALGLEIRYVTYANPGLLADAAVRDEWDIALVGAEPQRAETIAFTTAYSEIEATYLVPPGSSLRSIADVDAPGVRVALPSGPPMGSGSTATSGMPRSCMPPASTAA